MNQKYIIKRDEENKQLIIKEFAELDREILSLLYEQKYEERDIKSAISKKDRNLLLSAIRTKNFFPVAVSADKIVEAVLSLYGGDKNASVEVTVDDRAIMKEEQDLPKPEEGRSTPVIDDILDDPVSPQYDEKIKVDKFNSGIKIADDEPADIDEEI